MKYINAQVQSYTAATHKLKIEVFSEADPSYIQQNLNRPTLG